MAVPYAPLPGLVGSGVFVKALAAGGKRAPQYFSYCLDRSLLAFSVAFKKLKTQPHNTSKKLRERKKNPSSKAILENFFQVSHIYIILRAALSLRGICGWQCSKLGGWQP